MPMTLDGALGIHQQALLIRAARARLLAGNIANADTPNYKARDIDFKTALKQLQQQSQTNSSSDTRSTASALDSVRMLYRTPEQPSIDGNTVDMQHEQVEFGHNAVRYQASLRFLDGRIKGLLLAIRGE